MRIWTSWPGEHSSTCFICVYFFSEEVASEFAKMAELTNHLIWSIASKMKTSTPNEVLRYISDPAVVRDCISTLSLLFDVSEEEVLSIINKVRSCGKALSTMYRESHGDVISYSDGARVYFESYSYGTKGVWELAECIDEPWFGVEGEVFEGEKFVEGAFLGRNFHKALYDAEKIAEMLGVLIIL